VPEPLQALGKLSPQGFKLGKHCPIARLTGSPAGRDPVGPEKAYGQPGHHLVVEMAGQPVGNQLNFGHAR
jgi:hypothetical protein